MRLIALAIASGIILAGYAAGTGIGHALHAILSP